MRFDYSDQLVVQGDRGIPLPGKVCFMSEKVPNVLNLVFNHRRSFLEKREREISKK